MRGVLTRRVSSPDQTPHDGRTAVSRQESDAELPPGAGLYLTKDELQNLYEAVAMSGLLTSRVLEPTIRKLERGMARCRGAL